jgi:parvulin-like peptidyl-prolyl isomerase
VTRRLPLALAALALASGCGRTGIGVAARVGDTRIETQALTERVERGYANRAYAQQHPKSDYQRLWLTRLVNAELVRVAARRLHVTVTVDQVDTRYQQFVQDAGGEETFVRRAAQEGFARADLRTVIAEFVLRDAVADKLVEDVVVSDEQLRAAYAQALPQFDVAHIAHISVADKKTADDVAAQARAAGADFAKLAKKYSKDVNTATEGGDLGTIGNGDGKFQKSFEQAVFTGHTGSVVGPIKAQSGYEIVKVIERRTRTFEQARDEVRRAVIGQQRDDKFAAYMTALAKELHVSVNPRFGRWDPARGVTATAGDDLSSPAPSPGDNPAAPAAPGVGGP